MYQFHLSEKTTRALLRRGLIKADDFPTPLANVLNAVERLDRLERLEAEAKEGAQYDAR